MNSKTPLCRSFSRFAREGDKPLSDPHASMRRHRDENVAVEIAGIFHFNRRLESEAELSTLNESLLETRLRDLDDMGPVDERIYWLTLARLTELTLYCAGNYADGLHFREAGDLLLNPRLVLVTAATDGRVYAKERHQRMSEQFRSLIGAGKDPVLWLKKEMTPRIRKEALLPELLGRMKHDSCLSEAYVSSVEERMKKIAGTIDFVSAWHVRDSVEFHQRLEKVGLSERKAIESQLCRFDKKTFEELGHDLYEIANDEHYLSRFLRGNVSARKVRLRDTPVWRQQT
jgi:hypothetical protein